MPHDEHPIAYLASEYPAVSHTFIFHEVRHLRRRGLTIATFSVNRPSRPEVMSAGEREDAARTRYLKTRNPLELCRAHARLLRASPAAYLRMLRYAMGLMLRGPKSPLLALGYFAEAGMLLAGMQDAGARHVHVHFSNPAATVAMISASSGLADFSISEHGPDSFFNIAADLTAEKAARAVFVRCISHFCRSQLMRLLPFAAWDKLHIVRCGIDPGAFAPVTARPPGRRANILCVGRLTPAKGQHLLVQAVAALVEAGRDVELTLVGDGPDRQSLSELAASRGIGGSVRMTGAVGLDKIHSYYEQADIFVLPSFAEGVPIVLMEAMCAAIPCISTRIAGIPELIEHGESGLLTAAGDMHGLTEAIARLLDDPELRQTLAARGRAAVLENYVLERNCGTLLRLLRDATNGGAHARP